MSHQHTLQSPIGPITLEVENDQLISVTIENTATPTLHVQPNHPVVEAAVSQFDEYFRGARTHFDLPLNPRGTQFQQAIWAQLQKIPYGSATSYQKLGESAGLGKAPRAVGGAVGANPLPIVIPCHRVLAADNKITGYSGGQGIPTKKILLDLEGISYR
jgi:methylated-DNA-[protein]-cysteine S-methyltransferase